MSDSIWSAAFEALESWGDFPCLVELPARGKPLFVSAEQLTSQIGDASHQLTQWGAGRSTLVGLFLENSVDFIVIMMALVRIGAVPVFGKLEYRSVELWEYFANADPPIVISETYQLPVLAAFLEGRCVISRSERGLQLAQAGSAPPVAAQLPEDTASINYTYRGYGYPLGAVISHQQYLHGARVLQRDGLEASSGDRMLYSIPMSHIFTLVGCIMVPLLYGLTGVVARTIHPRVLFEAIAELHVQHVTAVPELYSLMRRAKKETTQLPSLEVFVSGGSPLSAEEYHLLRSSFAVEVLHGYGLTEFTPVSRNSRGCGREITVGRICADVQCRIDSSDDSNSGDVLIQTATMSAGYFRRQRETLESRVGEWFHAGDIGRFDGEHLIFEGTTKRTCKVNGVMVDLEEVRRTLCFDRDVSDAIVTEEAGNLTADIVPARRFDPQTKPAELRHMLKEHLAAYKTPKTINILR